MSNELRFLLIDDHEDTILYIQEIIKAAYPSKISFAKSGNEAIQLFKKGCEFDIVISDYQMPDGDGQLVFNYLQSLSNPIPFILHTSSIHYPKFIGKNFLGVVEKGDWNTIVKLIKALEN